jgi:two-component system chemotaxis response regulator CheY
MASVGLFFGSDTGNTEAVAGMIQKELGSHLVDVFDIAKSTKADIESFDLLISDINMPQMNGLDLAREIKNDARFKQKPILILTTESSADMKQMGKDIGVTGWMVKPFSDEKLVKSIKMVLGI